MKLLASLCLCHIKKNILSDGAHLIWIGWPATKMLHKNVYLQNGPYFGPSPVDVYLQVEESYLKEPNQTEDF